MRTFAFEDIDVGGGWTASFHATIEIDRPFVWAFWAMHSDGRSIIDIGGINHEPSFVGKCDNATVHVVCIRIDEWINENCHTLDRLEALSSKLRVERDLRARMKP